MQLRPYQEKVIADTLAGFQQFNRQLAVLPTGGGKTIIFSKLAQQLQPKRTLILAHREELVDQAIEKLHRSTGIFAGKEKAEFEARHTDPVVVASVQTMIRRLDKWPADHFGLVVVDEAHHALAQSYRTVLSHFDGSALVLGVTATPDRGDKQCLGKYFENVPAEVTLFDLINQKYLSRIAVKSVPLQIDLRKAETAAGSGDYSESDLGDALEPYLAEIARSIATEAAWRRTLVFVPLIATSHKFVEACRAAGVNAKHIDGNSPDRKEILHDFANGRHDLLSNAMLLTEGFDDPGIDCVVILRPTKSRALYSQMVGRGTRIAAGKSNLLLLDFLWLHERHALIRPAHLVAKSDAEAKQITELAQTKPWPLNGWNADQFDLQTLATDAQAQREARLREELKAKEKRKARFIDPIEFSLSLGSFDAAEFQPTMKWESGPVTEKQRVRLERHKLDFEALTAGQASKIIELLDTRQRLGLATPRQIRCLRQFKHPNPETATFAEASKFLDARLGKQKQAA